MKTIKTINEEFDKMFIEYGYPDIETALYGVEKKDIKSFISSQIRELLEELVGEEIEAPTGEAKQFAFTPEYYQGWNDCRSELQEKIKKILL